MPATMPTACDAAASLLASVVSANGRVDAREVAELDRLHAYRRLGIQRERHFVERGQGGRAALRRQ